MTEHSKRRAYWLTERMHERRVPSDRALAVEAGKVDSLTADCHRSHQAIHAGMLRVGNGHTAADTCAT